MDLGDWGISSNISLLQCVAVHCSVLPLRLLQCVAVHCIVLPLCLLQCVAVHCSVLLLNLLQCAAAHCVCGNGKSNDLARYAK